MSDVHPSRPITSALGGMLLGLAIAAAGAVFVWLMWASFQRARVMDAWTAVPCLILESRLTEEILNPNTPVNYVPLVRYRYEAGGRTHESTRLRRIETKSSRRQKMETLIAPFPAGSETTAWVNSADPADAVLVRDKRTAIYSIWFPALFVVGGLGIALSSLVRGLTARKGSP
ncbi:MAG: DUF3592 domain-containing protein [Verrucomicrobiales bacterium]